jgi:uncharacterized protein (DUF1015 family)
MAVIHPFKGLRPRPDLVERVASPPYDVLSSEEARELAASNPYSFLHVVKAEIDLDPGIDVHSEEVYRRGADNLKRFVREGTLIRDAGPCFYIYEQTMGEHTQRGLMVGASAQEYEDGSIKKHEFTRRDKEDDRAHHVDVLNANTGPVMMAYKARPEIDSLINRIAASSSPDYAFTAEDGVKHVLWVVSRPADVAALEEAFAAVEALYIADGHHRSAAGYRVRNLRRDRNPGHTGNEEYNFFLAVVFPDNQLQILSYNRAVKDLNGLSRADFLARVGEKFTVAETNEPRPPRPRTFTMFLEGRWYLLTAKEGSFPAADPVLSLDVSILQNNLLNPVLGIDDPRTNARVDFIGGIRGTGELEKRCARDMAVAFALYPTRVDQLMSVADQGQVMPPKSTWFEPKLRSGMVTHGLE